MWLLPRLWEGSHCPGVRVRLLVLLASCPGRFLHPPGNEVLVFCFVEVDNVQAQLQHVVDAPLAVSRPHRGIGIQLYVVGSTVVGANGRRRRGSPSSVAVTEGSSLR